MHALPELPDRNNDIPDCIISISLQAGSLYGKIGEFVYNGRRKISELEWDLKPVIYAGSALSAYVNRRFLACIGYWSGVNDNTGDMEDTDWDNFGIKTRISHHNCSLIHARFFDVNAE